MATVTVVKAGVPGDTRFSVVTVQGDASYTTGGYAVDVSAAQVPTRRYGVLTDMTNAVAGVAYAVWDDTNKKIKFMSALATEVTNGTSVATCVVTLFFIGY